ncbi:asparagine--tRNA ligase [symbiont of Argiope bruennichi]|uniref:asparagine--tRNA ligase n=1 Tax=symbiont of Argiope bruennichi TaxID=2810479 RepID=UPI003DA4C600
MVDKKIFRVKNFRVFKKLVFIHLTDGSDLGFEGIIFDDNKDFSLVKQLKINSIVKIRGSYQEKNYKKDFVISSLEILSDGENNFLIQKKYHTLDFLRQVPHLRPFTNIFFSVFKIRSCLTMATFKFFDQENFVNVSTPIFTTNDAEGAGDTFSLDPEFFNKQSFLTVSGQLHLEPFAIVFNKVFCFNPAFRSEKSNTQRHLAEFWMLEIEKNFSSKEEMLLNVEKYLDFVAREVLKNCQNELKIIEKIKNIDLINKIEQLKNIKILKVSYLEVLNKLQQLQSEQKIFLDKNFAWGFDFDTEVEKYLVKYLYNPLVFIYDYPKEIKPFYMKLNNDQKTVACFDILLDGIGELVGGSERETDLNLLSSKNLPKNLDWYLNLRKQGSFNSAGYGLGFERLVMYFTGIENIKDVIPFPRSYQNLLF